MYIFGEDIERVRINHNGEKATASVIFISGLMATLIFADMKGWSWGTYVITEDGFKAVKPRVEETDPPKHDRDMVEMFRTGKEPRSHDSILKCVAVLQALEQSVTSGAWEAVVV
jgi:hypothetical protein